MTALKKPRVLFVDDEQRVLNSMRAMFGREYKLFLTTSGAEALKIIYGDKIDVVVADHGMVGVSGLEVLAWARVRSPYSVRVLIADYTVHDAVTSTCAQNEVFRCLPKPCLPEQLRAALRDAVDYRHNQSIETDEDAAAAVQAESEAQSASTTPQMPVSPPATSSSAGTLSAGALSAASSSDQSAAAESSSAEISRVEPSSTDVRADQSNVQVSGANEPADAEQPVSANNSPSGLSARHDPIAENSSPGRLDPGRSDPGQLDPEHSNEASYDRSDFQLDAAAGRHVTGDEYSAEARQADGAAIAAVSPATLDFEPTVETEQLTQATADSFAEAAGQTMPTAGPAESNADHGPAVAGDEQISAASAQPAADDITAAAPEQLEQTSSETTGEHSDTENKDPAHTAADAADAAMGGPLPDEPGSQDKTIDTRQSEPQSTNDAASGATETQQCSESTEPEAVSAVGDPESGVSVLIYADDETFIETASEALQAQFKVLVSHSLVDSIECLCRDGSEVILIDAGNNPVAVQRMLSAIRRFVPDVSIVAAVSEFHDDALTELTGSGDVVRFINQPLTAQNCLDGILAAQHRRESGWAKRKTDESDERLSRQSTRMNL